MKVRELPNHWEAIAGGELTRESYSLHLPLEDAAKIAALAEMFPRRSIETLLSDLLTAALEDLETSFPYERGHHVVGVDELGDPLFEDIGHTPLFLQLTRKHLERLRQRQQSH